ncbi:hypothetical protein GDO81_009693 [Engystomops pustulosus]|uniref:Ig-like domain-containing protein n=1 Tax=Engystomops pustulosus TaxID=76066 RepID=A0AAV7BTA6_ENGPU|nr:hypothetical protein GDO81_009693 [Engystomops pustulosus]
MFTVRSILTNLIIYSLTYEGKVYADSILQERTGNITCNGYRQKNFVWYTYDAEYFKRVITNKSKTHEVLQDGGIFTCDESEKLSNVSCKTNKILIVIPIITGNNAGKSKKIAKPIGENVTFQSHFIDTSSYTLLWIVKQQDISKCIYSAAARRSSTDHEFSLHQLCCSRNDTDDEKRIHFRNLTALSDSNQTIQLDLVNLTSSDSGEYLCIKYFHSEGSWKWKILNKYSLKVTGDEDPMSTSEIPLYIIAGPIGGLVAVLFIVLLAYFCIKNRDKRKKTNTSSPVGLSDDYECMPYAVSERKGEMPRTIYSLAQNPVPTIDAEYSEVQLTNLTLSSAYGSKSDVKANIPNAEYAEIKSPKKRNEEAYAYSVVNIVTL